MEFEFKEIQMDLSEEIQMVLKISLNIKNSNGVGDEFEYYNSNGNGK